MTRQKCVECGKNVMGRADKKFCSDHCRNSRYNRLNKDANNYMRQVNNILRKNRRILSGLNPKGRIKVSKLVLVKYGFDFNFITSTFTDSNGDTYYFCYDQGYLSLRDDMYLLVIK